MKCDADADRIRSLQQVIFFLRGDAFDLKRRMAPAPQESGFLETDRRTLKKTRPKKTAPGRRTREEHSYAFRSFKAGEGVSIHVLPIRKFKTTTMCLMIGRELDEDSTHAALLAETLNRASAKYPDMRAIAEQMERMYGASFGCGIGRIGGKQVLSMRLGLPGESFLPRRTALNDRGFDFLREMLLRPPVSGGTFETGLVRREKHNLRSKIASLANDKMAYAQRRCMEEMCRNERFRFYEYGDIEKVGRITPLSLFGFYREMLATRPVDFFIVGDVPVEKSVDRVRSMFKWRRPGAYSFDGAEDQPLPRRPRRIIERQDVAQAKLCLGVRTYTGVGRPEYPAAVFYNGLLGGFSHSKLFRNVREKAGLAYEAHSFLENSKGLLLIAVGLEGANSDRAVRIIRRQMDDLREGKISRDEILKTRKGIVNRLRSSLDSPSQLINLYYSQMINGVTASVDEWARRIEAVRPSDIKALARKAAVDTVYLLAPDGAKVKT